MKRITLMLIRNIIFLPYMITRLLYHAAHVDKYTDEEHNQMLKFIVKKANKGGNVTLEEHGIENIPNENGFMIYPNHQGMYDMLALVGTCHQPLSTISKIEVQNVIFLKHALKCIKAFYIDRSNVKQSMQVILKVIEQVKLGRNYVIFAEGTRSKNGNNTLEFKGGSFKVATKTKCPIVPVALVNSFIPFDSKTIKQITVQVHYLKPLMYEDYKEMKTTEIAEYVRTEIQKVLDSESK